MQKSLLFIIGIVVCLVQPSCKTERADWFEFHPGNSLETGAIGMTDWLDKPAGKHGFLLEKGDAFYFEDGTPIKFWGTNHGGGNCGPDSAEAVNRARWYAKMGINAVRMHKFSYSSALGDKQTSVKLSDKGWKKLDFYQHQLRENGIYYSWSPYFRHNLIDGDSTFSNYFHEMKDQLDGKFMGIVNFAPDLQDFLITHMVNLLTHVNPYTGLNYAHDPALVSVEMQNEDNIYWIKPDELEKVPSYKAMFCQQYSDWLLQKYSSEKEMLKAWGANALDMFPEYQKSESLQQKNIYPIAWFPKLTPEALQDYPSQERIKDNIEFLNYTQKKYYDRYLKAIRGTGYIGPVVAGCWQAGYGVTHYYNILADAEVGPIDRHNYFGPRAHGIDTGRFYNASQLTNPGTGLLSAGFQMVEGKPFVLSEWISKMPNEWIAESLPIIAVYGLGLQGWDGSYHFASDGYGFSEQLENPNVYNTNLISQIGQFPALARMIYRGDVHEGHQLNYRYVHLPSLRDYNIEFKETNARSGDVKEIESDFPSATLAYGQVDLKFVNQFTPTIVPNIATMLENKEIYASTDQLYWNYQDKGYFTANTMGTKLFCGFSPEKKVVLGKMSILPKTDFSIIIISAKKPSRTIENADTLLLTTIGRVRNKGMEIEYLEPPFATLNSKGTQPVMIEAVDAIIHFDDGQDYKVNFLDHDGLRTGASMNFKDKLVIDGRKNKSIWYEIIKL
jgi:hypothetical protein